MGRTADLTYAMNGFPVTTARVESIINKVDAVADYQVFQKGGVYHVHIVLEEDVAASRPLTEEIIESLLMLYGRSAVIKVQFVPEITAEPSGKYRRTRSDIQPDYDQLFVRETVT
jgi:acyl-coenzyme A synthetase/AMP-(fatty) acid ligase